MVAWLIRKLKYYHAKLITAENDNRLPGGRKPDIFLKVDGVPYYLDIGFTNTPEAYSKIKIKNY